MRGRSVAVLVLCGLVTLEAQTPKPTLEVASVKDRGDGLLTPTPPVKTAW